MRNIALTILAPLKPRTWIAYAPIIPQIAMSAHAPTVTIALLSM